MENTATDGTLSSQRSPIRICAVTYLERPSHCPPLYHAALSLARRGFSIRVLCLLTSRSPERDETLSPGFSVHRVALWSRELIYSIFGSPVRYRLVAAIQHGLSYGEFLVKAIGKACWERADLYEAHDLPTLLPAIIAAKFHGVPVVYHAHELYAEMHARVPFARFWSWLERQLLPKADLVITPEVNRSRILLEEFGARNMPLTIQNCPPYSPPLESNNLQERWKARGLSPRFIALYQGLVDSERCIEEIVASASRYNPGVVLTIVGHGFGRWASPQEVIPSSERIEVIPFIPYDELQKTTASASAGILFYRNTCRNNYYCAPNKLYEYMMMGLPIITCDYPGLRRIVEGEEIGLCVNPEDPAAIAHAVNTLADNADLYARMKANCLRLSRERYNWEKEFESLLPAYESLQKKRP